MSSDLSKSVHPSALGFSKQAQNYEEIRPSYPKKAVEIVIQKSNFEGSKEIVLLELGSGTGKFTRLLVPYLKDGTISKIIATEPSEEMRKKLIETCPEVISKEGTGEKIPLEDNSVDLVVAAQAFHWFSTMPALKEINRVLKPGGKLFLIWNNSENKHLTSVVQDILSSYDTGITPQYQSMKWKNVFTEDNGNLFQKLEEQTIQNAVVLTTAEEACAALQTISFVAILKKEEQDRLCKEVIKALDDLSAFKEVNGKKVIESSLVTEVYWTTVNK